MSAIRAAVVICTRNRYDDLLRCLESLPAAVSRSAVQRVLIIDSSDHQPPDRLRSALNDISGVDCLLVQSDPGLTKQRNHGLRLVRDVMNVVHFIDDDVALSPRYFAELEQRLRDDGIVGVCGRQMNVAEPTRGWLEQNFLFGGSKPGRLLKSGLVVGVYDGVEREVEWLPGCAMSYRLDRIGSVEFDEWLSGYGLGEDIDFSSRVASFGKLLSVPSAEMLHHRSEVNRSAAASLLVNDVVNRGRRVLRRQGRVTAAFWAGLLAHVVLDLLAIPRHPRWSVLSLIAHLRGGLLVLRGKHR